MECLFLPLYSQVIESEEHEHGAYTVWAAPGSLRGLLHVRVQADHVVCSGTGVAEDDLSTLLAYLTVVLVVCLIAITIF